MKSRQHLNPKLTRRSWIVLTSAALTGCGGGGSGGISTSTSMAGSGSGGSTSSTTGTTTGSGVSTAGAPGTGGTGVYQGSITGFGSVIVNGVTYDNSQAVMRLNDLVVSQDTLRLGMVATVRGDRVAGSTMGTASSIEVWSIAQGVVSEVRAGQFKVAGMTILTNAATWLYGFAAEAPLSNGNYVSVWGLQADSEGHSWTASCVQASTADAGAVSSGQVSVEDGQRTLNGLRLTGTAANSLVDGVLVRVQGTWSSSTSLQVVSTKSIDSGVGVQPQDEVEIEGLVTTTPSATGFMLGHITVQASPASYSPAGAQISVGSRVEVYGSWQGGVLKATKVELEDAMTPGLVEIKAPFQRYTSQADFVLQGQRCDATGVVLSQSTTAALYKAGAVFKVKGTKNGDWLKVSSMELDH